jgi:hypothetical protein
MLYDPWLPNGIDNISASDLDVATSLERVIKEDAMLDNA